MIRWVSTVRITNKNDDAAKSNEQAQASFYNTVSQNYSDEYKQFTGATDRLDKVLNPIVSAGPGQYGFDPTEDAALRTGATEVDAAGAKNAEEAANQQITASNGGAPLMPTGAQAQLKQQSDIAAAQKTSADQNAITLQGYKQGTDNYNTALSGKLSEMGLMNPNSFASSVNGAGNATTGAVNAATSAEEASMGWEQMVGGALGGVAGSLTTNLLPKSK